MTLGTAAAAQVRLIVWCKGCGYQGEPEPAELSLRYGSNTTVLDWRERLVCSKYGGREVDFVASGTPAISGTRKIARSAPASVPMTRAAFDLPSRTTRSSRQPAMT